MARPQRRDEILGSELPPTLPLMALRSTIVYPLGTIAVQMGAPENLALLRDNEDAGLIVALVVAGGDLDEPLDQGKFIGRVGVAARVHERINLPGDTVQITLQGLRRITIEAIPRLEPYAIAQVKPAKETPADPSDLDDLVARIVSAAETLADLVDRIPDEVPQILKMNVSDPGRFADLAATNMNFRISDKDEVLQRVDPGYGLRVAGLAMATACLGGFWIAAMLTLLAQEEAPLRELRQGRVVLKDHNPFGGRVFGRGIRDYLRRDFHPSQATHLDDLAEEVLRSGGYAPRGGGEPVAAPAA